MFKQFRFIFTSAVLLLMLFISMARPYAVYADDSTPPPPATEETTNPPTDTVPAAAATEAPPTDAPTAPTEAAPTEVATEAPPTEAALTEVPTEAPPTDAPVAPTEATPAESGEWSSNYSNPTAEVAPTEVATEAALADPTATTPPDPAAAPVTVSEVLQAAPETTNVVVLDASGVALPLASTAAAEIVDLVDPMWCPVGVLPGGVGCSNSYSNISSLVNDMRNNAANYSGDGTIYFTTNPGNQSFALTDAGGSLGTSFDILKNFNLTLQGGWNGLNDGSGFALSGQTNFVQKRVQVGTSLNPWAGSVTVNNISIDGVLNNNTGLLVHTAGDININYVDVQNTTGTGAGSRLFNDSGNGKITIQHSSFNNNGGRGLEAYSTGDFTLLDVIANGNVLSGAKLENRTGAGNVTVTASALGNSSFSQNTVDGLDVYSTGTITVDSILANNNGEIGASLNNDAGEGDVFVSNSVFNSNTSIAGIGQNMGLEIFSTGEVSLENITANGNTGADGISVVGFSSLLVFNGISNNNENGLYAEGESAEVICSQFSNNNLYGVEGSLTPSLSLNDVVFSGNGSGEYSGSAFVTTGGCAEGAGGTGGDEGGVDEGGGEEGGGEEGTTVCAEEDPEDCEEEGEEEEGGGPTKPKEKLIIPLTSLGLNIVPVAGAEQIGLDCNTFGGTKLILPNGDNVVLPCPLQDQGSLAGVTNDDLPGPLDAQFGFFSSMNAEVIRGGQTVSTLDTNMVIDFIVPSEQQNASFTILHWDASQSQWVEVPGGHLTAGGYFETTTHLTGIFVLVTK